MDYLTRIRDIEQRLWQAADELRANSRLNSQEDSLPVLELIFLKYADVRFGRAQERLMIRILTDQTSI